MAIVKLVKAVGKKLRNKLKEKERKESSNPRKPPEDPSPGQSAFSNPENLKTATGQPGKRKPRTKTEAELTAARRMKKKKDAATAANVETGKKVLTGTALVGAGAVGGYAAGKSKKPENLKNLGKPEKPKKPKKPKKPGKPGKPKTQAEKLKQQLKAESSGDRVKRSNPPKRATVTGKKDDIASRNISNEGKKQANVTREQLKRLGLDPKKKSSLTIYLNAYDRLNRRPKTKADLVAKKNMGGMMKSKGYAMGGMMKSKGSAKGGNMGGKMASGYKKGGVAKKNMGGMMKSKGSAKGGKMGGKMMPGYKKGGAVKKVSGGKRRGVGVAIRGFGKAMR